MTLRFFYEPGPDLGFVDVVLAFDTGAAGDPLGKEGLTLLTLRLMRCGTGDKTRAETDAEVERLGASIEVGVGLHRGSIRGRVIRENLEPFARLMLGLVLEPALREDDFVQAQRLLVADVMAKRDDDRELAGRAFRRVLFDGGRHGRPSSGTAASLRRITRDDCVRRHRELCARDTILVAAAGDVGEDDVRRLLLDPLATLPESGPAFRLDDPPVPPRGVRALLVDKPERTQAQIYMGHLGPKPGREHHDGLLVSSTAFGQTFSSRLMQEVRVRRGWSYGAYCRLTPSRTDDSWFVWFFPAAKDLEPCIRLVHTMLGDLQRDGVTPEELAFAKGYLVGSSVFLVDTPVDRLERQIEVATLGFPPDYYSRLADRVQAVTLEQARASTRASIHPDDLVVAVVCTAAKHADDVRRALGNEASLETIAFDDDTL